MFQGARGQGRHLSSLLYGVCRPRLHEVCALRQQHLIPALQLQSQDLTNKEIVPPRRLTSLELLPLLSTAIHRKHGRGRSSLGLHIQDGLRWRNLLGIFVRKDEDPLARQ